MRRSSKNWLFLLLALLYGAIFFAYYPPIFAIEDESNYFGMAYVIRQGTIFPDQTEIPINRTVGGSSHRVSFHPIGMSLLLAPLTYLGWRSVFLLNLTFHLLGAYFFSKLLRIFNLSSWLVALYLFFPSYVFYSRTLMSDIPSTAIFIAAVYCYLTHSFLKPIAGALLGANLFLRPTNVLLALPFLFTNGIKNVVQAQVKGNKRLELSMGIFFFYFLPFPLMIALLNTYTLGSPFLLPYFSKFTGIKNFSLSYFPQNAPFYLLSLMLVYPLMLVSSVFAKKTRRLEFLLAILLMIGFHSFYFYRDKSEYFTRSLVVGMRFLLPILPLLLLNYAELLEQIVNRLGQKHRMSIVGFLIGLLIISTWIIHAKHQVLLREHAELRDTIYGLTEEGSTLIYDAKAGMLVQSVWGRRRYILLHPAIDLRAVQRNANGHSMYLLSDGSAPLSHLVAKTDDLVLAPIAQKRWLRIDKISYKPGD